MPKPHTLGAQTYAGRPSRAALRHLAQGAGLAAVLLCGDAAAQAASPGLQAPQRFSDQVIAAPDAHSLKLFIDFAVIVRISGDVSAIVLGSSDIADASIVSDGLMALTGKAVGTTNILVLGPDDTVLTHFQVHVGGDKPGSVTVHRALRSSSYACTNSACWRSDGGSDAAVAAP